MDTVAYTNPLNTLTLSTVRSTNFIPVMLPLGSVTMSSIVSASAGVFVPFFLFACFMFSYLYSIWRANAKPFSSSSLSAIQQQQQQQQEKDVGVFFAPRGGGHPSARHGVPLIRRQQVVSPAFFAPQRENEYARMLVGGGGGGNGNNGNPGFFM
jgi:hypothetical protein